MVNFAIIQTNNYLKLFSLVTDFNHKHFTAQPFHDGDGFEHPDQKKREISILPCGA